MSCVLFGQVDIELSGTKELEIVLEGSLTSSRYWYVNLKGMIDIESEGMNDIYLEGITQDPLLGGELGLTLDLEGCLITDKSYISPTPTPSITVTPTMSNTPRESITPTVTPTNTPTPSVTMSTPVGYDAFAITPCCDNMSPLVNTIPNAYIPSSYGLTNGDVVSLDGICYTIQFSLPSATNYPSSIVTYSDAETCVQDTDNEPCAYTLQACAETVASLGDVLVQPTKINILVNDIYTTTQYRQIGSLITNSSLNTFQIQDCYSTITYDETVDFVVPDSIGGATDCLQVGKCEVVHVLLTNCVDNKTSIAQFEYEILTGNTLNSGDTISAPAIGYYNVNTTTGSCYNIGGKTSIINTPQTSLAGTGWNDTGTQFSVETNCEDGDCGCKTNFLINDVSGGGISNVYYKGCNGATYGPFTISAGGSLSVTQCVNINSVWAYAYIMGYYGDISITGTYSNC